MAATLIRMSVAESHQKYSSDPLIAAKRVLGNYAGANRLRHMVMLASKSHVSCERGVNS